MKELNDENNEMKLDANHNDEEITRLTLKIVNLTQDLRYLDESKSSLGNNFDIIAS